MGFPSIALARRREPTGKLDYSRELTQTMRAMARRLGTMQRQRGSIWTGKEEEVKWRKTMAGRAWALESQFLFPGPSGFPVQGLEDSREMGEERRGTQFSEMCTHSLWERSHAGRAIL